MQQNRPTPDSLEVALRELLTARNDTSEGDPYPLAAAARNVTRMADEIELIAFETGNIREREGLLNSVATARKEVRNARQIARERALEASRNALFTLHSGVDSMSSKFSNGGDKDVSGSTKKNSMTLSNGPRKDASRLVNDINETLRRATAVVSDEVARSQATGAVFDESTRKLRMTKDQHIELSGSLGQGTKILRRLHLSEFMANSIVIASFAFFFLVAAYVLSNKRVLH